MERLRLPETDDSLICVSVVLPENAVKRANAGRLPVWAVDHLEKASKRFAKSRGVKRGAERGWFLAERANGDADLTMWWYPGSRFRVPEPESDTFGF